MAFICFLFDVLLQYKYRKCSLSVSDSVDGQGKAGELQPVAGSSG